MSEQPSHEVNEESVEVSSLSEYEQALARGDERALSAIDELDYDRLLWGQFP